jgi:hypothetical protein
MGTMVRPLQSLGQPAATAPVLAGDFIQLLALSHTCTAGYCRRGTRDTVVCRFGFGFPTQSRATPLGGGDDGGDGGGDGGSAWAGNMDLSLVIVD